jgi:hypothetical protein
LFHAQLGGIVAVAFDKAGSATLAAGARGRLWLVMQRRKIFGEDQIMNTPRKAFACTLLSLALLVAVHAMAAPPVIIAPTVDGFVLTYAGDGISSLNDFDRGTLHTSFKYSGGPKTIRLDVTSVVNNLLVSGEEYAGFNFQFAIPSPIELNGPFIAFHTLEVPPAAYLRITDHDAPDRDD